MNTLTASRSDGISYSVVYPTDWTQEKRGFAENSISPRFAIRHPDGHPEIQFTFHGRWEDDSKEAYISFFDETLNELFEERVDQLINPRFALEPIEGAQVFGRYILMSYKLPDGPLAPQDNFKHMVVAKLLADQHYVFATIAFNEQDSPSFNEALSVLRSIKASAASN